MRTRTASLIAIPVALAVLGGGAAVAATNPSHGNGAGSVTYQTQAGRHTDGYDHMTRGSVSGNSKSTTARPTMMGTANSVTGIRTDRHSGNSWTYHRNHYGTHREANYGTHDRYDRRGGWGHDNHRWGDHHGSCGW
jgi:hypothetical protein